MSYGGGYGGSNGYSGGGSNGYSGGGGYGGGSGRGGYSNGYAFLFFSFRRTISVPSLRKFPQFHSEQRDVRF